MKITYLVTWGAINGGLRVVCEQTNRLIERGHKVKILTLKKEKPDWYPFKAEIINVPTFEGRIPVSDIIVACFSGAALPASTVIKEIPFYLVQAYEPGLYPDSEYREICKGSYQLPLNLLCVAGWLKDLMEDRFFRKSHIIPNGVNLEEFRPIPPLLKTKCKRILMMYSDVEVKGPLDGLKALGLVKRECPEVEVMVFGETPPPKLGFPVIFFHKPSKDRLAGIYSSADVFLSSSIEEGFGMPQLEAMACGVAVVTTDSKGMREYAIDGKTALVVPTKNPEALAHATIRLLENEPMRKEIARAGYEKAKSFTWERSIDGLEQLFLKALQIHSAREPQDWSSWEKVIMLNPDDCFAHYAFGVELKKIGKLREAKREFETAIQLNPDFLFAYREMGKLLSEMGNNKEAIEYLRRAKERFAKDQFLKKMNN
jgi:glycosyltransferase involved in cell wall biosynthesis